jgi:amino acid transporter
MDSTYTASRPGSAPPASDGRGTPGSGEPRAHLGLFDAVCIIIGIVIGSTIYKSPQLIMANVSSPTMGMIAWGVGGLLSLIGALCYAELASTYPRSGGDYVFLSRAYGSWCGFLFGWAQLAVILTGSIGAMAFVFGDYAVRTWGPPGTVVSAELAEKQGRLQKEFDDFKTKVPESQRSSISTPPELAEAQDQIQAINTRRDLWAAVLAVAAVAALTLMNVLGVVLGKLTQNLLSVAKIVGLGGIVYLGFLYGQVDAIKDFTPPPADSTNFGLAMVFVLYAFGGWNDSAFVAAEVRNRRNIIRSLILGTLIITVVYLAVNAAYLRVLGFDGMRNSFTVAAEVGKKTLGDQGDLAISVLVMISALGAINGLIFTGSRVYSTLGADYGMFAALGRWHPRLRSPVWALSIQAVVVLLMVVAVGTPVGRDWIDTGMTFLSLNKIPWARYFGGFETLVSGTAPVFWGFFLLSGLSLFALRQRDPDVERPFSVPLYPLLPLIFCGYCGYMLYSALDYAKWVALIGAIPLAFGLVLYAFAHRSPSRDLPFSASSRT